MGGLLTALFAGVMSGVEGEQRKRYNSVMLKVFGWWFGLTFLVVLALIIASKLGD
jgi:hypothetical protein